MLPPGQTWHSVIWCLVFGISWTEHRSNQEVLDMVDENRSLNTIRQRQKNWLGHVLRSESHLCTVGIHFSTQERTRTRETECYDDRLDEEQRRGIWTYKEKSLWQRRLASLESWTCLKRHSTQERGGESGRDRDVTMKKQKVVLEFSSYVWIPQFKVQVNFAGSKPFITHCQHGL